jgi:hypothetical protein
MRGLVGVSGLAALLAVATGLAAVPAAPALASSSWADPQPPPAGQPWPMPPAPEPQQDLAVLGGSSAQAVAAETAAAARARATRRPVAVPSLTSETSTVSVRPDGVRVLRDNVLPVRVRRGSGWVPVDTSLRRTGNGRLSPAAVPGDTVTFSGGGTAPMVALSADGARLALSWPGPLPAPVVSGSSASYRNVFPGVDLVLTAISTVSGGCQEVLVVRDAAAARDRGLAHVALRVSTSGTRRQCDRG